MEIFVSAGEASSDIHCAHLLAELKKLVGPGLKAFGLGGDRLAEQGAELLMHNRELSVGGGPLEVISKIPTRHRLEQLLEKRLFEGPKVDGAIVVDNGEINLRLSSLLHFFNVPVVYFIPPKVWVWRHSRIEDIDHHIELVLGILPFEQPIYEAWQIPFQYVGNPLIDEVDSGMSQQEAKRRLGVAAEKPVLAVLTGSRHNEVAMHAKVFAEAARRFIDALPAGEFRPTVALPAAQAIDPEFLRLEFETALKGSGAEVLVTKGMSHECMKAARVALVKSGTSTLECALLGTPMVLAYGASRSAAWVYRHIVRYRGFVGLVNLFLAENPEDALGWGKPVEPLVPELILEKCRPELIAAELQRLWHDGAERDRMVSCLARTSTLLAPKGSEESSPLKIAAAAALEVFSGKRPPRKREGDGPTEVADV